MDEIIKIEQRLNDGIERTKAEHEKCVEWLTEFYQANDMTLNELDELCHEDSNWVFEQIFGDGNNFETRAKCTWCGEWFSHTEVVHELNLGCLCHRCADAIRSRGEKLTIVD